MREWTSPMEKTAHVGWWQTQATHVPPSSTNPEQLCSPGARLNLVDDDPVQALGFELHLVHYRETPKIEASREHELVVNVAVKGTRTPRACDFHSVAYDHSTPKHSSAELAKLRKIDWSNIVRF